MQTSNTETPTPPPHTDASGLTETEAARRLAQDGPNALQASRHHGLRWLLHELAEEPMFLLLSAAGLLYLLLGDLHEGLVLFGMVLVVLALTLYQEGKTAQALAALRALSAPRAKVLRDGQPRTLDATDVVCGDLLVLGEGERVAADGWLVSGSEVQVDESMLSGESLPVDKGPNSQLWAGTLLVRGHGLMQVSATGARSQMGRIGAALHGQTAATSPLRLQTRTLVHTLAWIAFAASVLLMLAYGLSRGDWLGAVLAGIALAMALLPQEFTVVLTVIPALGAWRLSQQQVLTRKLGAIETLGATSVLCVDKTGTLTENRMRVQRLRAWDALAARPGDALVLGGQATPGDLPEEFHALLEYSILASLSEPFDPMEKAFHALGQQTLQDTEHLHRDWVLRREYGLSPQLRAMSHVWFAHDGQRHVVAAKGSPEAIADLCHLNADARAHMDTAAQALAAQGLRVLGVARATHVGEDWPAEEHDFDFEPLGLLGLADPLRDEVPAAVAQCHAAGIRVVMITGDHAATAAAIAQQAGLALKDPADVLRGDEIDALDDAQLSARMATVQVCARVAPAQKLRIVQALQARGEVVAMTGDGVNDAPALARAHVGVAMGARGTDVAREAAALVLMDDNFRSIVGAVRMGRRIFANLRQSMTYILAVHIPIAGLALLPVLLGTPVLLMPLHIVFLELVIDPACSLVFEAEPESPDSMQCPPRNVRAPLFDRSTLVQALLQGLGVLAIALLAWAWAQPRLDEGAARALVFTVLVVGNLALLLGNRTQGLPVWHSLRVPNARFWAVAIATLTLQGLCVGWAALHEMLRFSPLGLGYWLLGLSAALPVLGWMELLRRWRQFSAPAGTVAASR